MTSTLIEMQHWSRTTLYAATHSIAIAANRAMYRGISAIENVYCRAGGSRTRMDFNPPHFESGASTISATAPPPSEMLKTERGMTNI